MGVIYINGGYKKAKLPVDIKQTSIEDTEENNTLDIFVEEGNLVIDTKTAAQLDEIESKS